MRLVIIVLFIFFCSGLFFAQKSYYPVYHYESENGLIHLNVLSIKQNPFNVLYFVTQGGVYEYAGQIFQKKSSYSSLKNIRNIFFNDTCTFLVHRDNGLFYVKHNKIKPFFNQNPFKRPSDKIIIQDNFCFNYTDQIAVEFFDYKNNIYYNDSVLLNDNTNQAYCILTLKNKILVGRKKGLYIFDKNKFQQMQVFSKAPVYSIFYDADNHLLYLGSSGKILVIDDSLFQLQKTLPVTLPATSKSNLFLFQMERNISKLVVDKFNRIWFSIQPDDNIYLWNNNELFDVLDILNIPPTLINDIYLDNFNNIWIATFNDGVYQINSTYWQSYKIVENQKTLNIKQMEINHKYLFLATNNGLFYADTSQFNKIKAIVYPDNFFNTEIYNIQNFKGDIFASNIVEFKPIRYNISTSNVVVLPFRFFAIKNNECIYATDITNNILLYNIQKNKILDTIYKPSDFKLNIRHLFLKNDTLFVSTNKGLLLINDKYHNNLFFENLEIQKVIFKNNSLFILSENKIYDFYSKKIVFDAEKFNIVTLTDIEKFQDYYFVSSEEGMMLLDQNFQLLDYFGRRDGMISNVINDILILNNKLLVATDKGFSYTSIHYLLNHQFNINTPVISFVSTNTDTFYWHSSKSLIFDNSVQDIYFHLISPNYNPLTKVIFQYSLNNSDWINFENSPLHFSSLAGGNYELKIRSTIDKIHFTPPVVVHFRKELKLYERSWFWEFLIAVVLLLLFLVVFIIRKIDQKKSTEKLRVIQQMNLLKHQAMNAILSPHFIFNSLTGIQNYILKNDIDKASDYLSKFSRLIRMIIEKASQPTILLKDEIKRLQFYLELEKERFHDKFEFEIILDDKLDIDNIEIPNMIIQPYLENAILHGILPKNDSGHLTLSFKWKDNQFVEIIIEDDGIGIIKGVQRRPKHHKSLATQTIAEILQINTQLYQKQQSVEIIDKSNISKDQSGTIVRILIEL